MGKYILWLDLETTGLDKKIHAIIQISCLVEMDGQLIDEFNLFIRPFSGASVSRDALKKNNISIETLKTDKKYVSYNEAFKTFIEFMEKYVNRYKPIEKFVLAGKNVKFDIEFLREFFKRNNDDYYGSWFFYPCIEVESYTAEAIAFENAILNNYKLETLCESMNIELKNAHDSLLDIKATRELYWKYKGVNING